MEEDDMPPPLEDFINSYLTKRLIKPYIIGSLIKGKGNYLKVRYFRDCIFEILGFQAAL